ncbi:FAD/NAD(P)-binding domain-containing protein [Irpex rosettiformis]|uniref:FAD/NAD(P)-binding domain-containing protein n=1 Tax=Irpex rosettiformis TaxID=378272 RepID=A0ACB8TSA9_9APHY|nr:FAD/NAD(P)-binding domain-containing protein [Irpex rosettiformis]
MHVATVLLATYAFAGVGYALQLPFGLQFPWATARLNNQQLPLAISVEDVHAEPETPSNRIAIIGAGAGGSSAAFWIGKAKERWGLDVEVDVFEAKDYVGGRSTTVQPYNDSRLAPIELGASIFVKANKNLWRASEEFGLNLTDFSDQDGDDTIGIWDGKEFLLTTQSGTWGRWWTTIKVLWRYGVNAPRKTQALVKDMINTYLQLYSTSFGSSPWQDLSHLTTSFEWNSLLNSSATEYLDGQGINPKFTREMVESATRVNYGQNADAIHALEGFTSMAADNAAQVVGGNWQIFDQFIKHSNATLYLNTEVTSVTQKADDKFVLHYVTSGSEPTTGSYRAVIFAAPYHTSSIKLNLLDPSALPVIPPQPYVHLYVTLLSTPNPSARTRYFGLKEKDTVPSMVLTTWERARATEGQEAPEFNSLSYHGKIQAKDSEKNLTKLDVGDSKGRNEQGEEWSVKIFSDHLLEDGWLRKAFGRIGWVHRKEWDAYPVLPPTDTFPPVKLAQGLYYVNSFEPFISTMETETISSRNVVELLLQEGYNASICKPTANATNTDENEDFVYGFDC